MLLETLCPQWKPFHLKKSELVCILRSLVTINTSFTDSALGLSQTLHYIKLAGGNNKCLGMERYTISSITWKKILSLDFPLFINLLNTYPVGTWLDTGNQRWKKLIMCKDVDDEPIIYFPFRFWIYFSGVSFCFCPLKFLYLFQILRVLRSNSETTSKQLVSFKMFLTAKWSKKAFSRFSCTQIYYIIIKTTIWLMKSLPVLIIQMSSFELLHWLETRYLYFFSYMIQ